MGAQWNDGRRFVGRVAVVTGGREELDAARNLANGGFPRQATSRAYYAAFYAARAALEAAGEPSPKTHSGMRSRFSALARSIPSIGPEVGRALSQLGTDRAEADYDEPTVAPPFAPRPPSTRAPAGSRQRIGLDPIRTGRRTLGAFTQETTG